MKKVIRNTVMIAVSALLIVSMIGCVTHEHIVGTGAATGYTESAKQWYIIGLLPLNNVDTKAMSGNAENYKIVTQTSIIDALISSVTGGILTARTVQVIK